MPMLTQLQQTQFTNSMVEQGMDRAMAVALAGSVAHSLESASYAREYGTYMVEKLVLLVETATQQK